MSSTHIVEITNEGAAQIVRIPESFHLDAKAVEIRRNETTGELILTPSRPRTWAEFFASVNESAPESEFMDCRPLNVHTVGRDIFADDAD